LNIKEQSSLLKTKEVYKYSSLIGHCVLICAQDREDLSNLCCIVDQPIPT